MRCQHQTCRSQQGYLLITVVVTLFILSAIVLLLNRESSINMSLVRSQQQADTVRYVAEAGMQHAIVLANSSNCTGYSLTNKNFGEHSYSATFSPVSGSPVSITTKGSLVNGLSRDLQRDGVLVYQKSQYLKLQLGPTQGKDTHIYKWKPTWNFGADPNLVVSGEPDSIENSLLQFDLSAIPVGVKVISAELALYSNSKSWGSTIVDVHRITRGWVEGIANGGNGSGANWTEADTGTTWSVNGGDFASFVSASATTLGDVGWVSWDITNLVTSWVSGSVANHGLLIRATELYKGAQFDSREASSAGLRPKLTIIYACECGKVCGAPAPVVCNADFLADTLVSEFPTTTYGSGVQKDLDYIPTGDKFLGKSIPSDGAWISVDRSAALIYLTDMTGSLLSSSAGTSSMGGIAYIASGTWAGHIAVSDFGHDDVRFYDSAGTEVGSFSLSGFMVGTPSGAAFIDVTTSGIYDSHLAITDRPKNLVYIADQVGILKTTLDLSAYASGLTDVAHIPNSDKLLVLDENKKVYIIAMDGSKTGEYDVSSFSTSGTVGLAINPLTCDHVIGDDGVDKVISLNVNNPGTGSVTTSIASAADTFLRGGSSTNFGSDDAIKSGRDNGGPLFYGLLKFDVASIPASAVISSAKLRLYQFSSKKSGNMSVGVHRIDQAWTENEADWSTADGSTAWSVGVGGTYSSPAVSNTDISIGSYTWYEWDVTPLMQEWVDGIAPNFGIELIHGSVNAGTNVSFASKEHADTSLHPQLLIEYTSP